MSMIMLLSVISLERVIKNNALCLTFQILVGGTIYITLSAILKNKSYIYLKNILKHKIIRG